MSKLSINSFPPTTNRGNVVLAMAERLEEWCPGGLSATLF